MAKEKINNGSTAKALAGRTFGRWTVQDSYELTPKGERKWMCRCECGTFRYVLERSLIYGGSVSCGCLRKEKVHQAVFHDLTGQTFGELTVIRRLENKQNNKGALWLCRCSCGAEYETYGTLLMTGQRTRCSGSIHEKNYVYTDITGQKFAHLTALYPVRGSQSAQEQKRSKSMLWHCRCDCGNEVDVPYNSLVYTDLKSCGCQKKEHDRKLQSFLTRVDGTSMDMIRSKKVPSDNTSGCRGVYRFRGKYAAKIVFQKKAYYLGSFPRLEDAVQVRKEAEELLFDGATAFYDKWKERAAADPQWASENPVEIRVTRDTVRGLQVEFLPEMK